MSEASSKRARVMARSKALGHCICDPRKNCPCDIFLQRDVCLCAGERLEEPLSAEKPGLMKRMKNAGCASKIPAADLARILSRLPAASDPRLLVGLATADDAGVFQISPDLCLVQTVDVFAPCVDDPYQFGQIAACNSLSDVYAMGGAALTALSIIGYPIHTLGDEAMYQMLKGGLDKLNEAGVLLVGGHSINEEEIKFGFAVTGVVRPDAIVTNAGAQPGDALILSKPLGTGIISFAAQMGRASAESARAAALSMSTLNKSASEVMVRMGAHACTDVTGFGLLGHLRHVVRESGVTAEVWWEAMPLLPGVAEYAAQGIGSGAAERNREFAGAFVEAAKGLPEHALDILYDAQTSGGLLIALPEAKAAEMVSQLRAAGCRDAAVIGRVVEKSKGKIVVTRKKTDSPARVSAKQSPCCAAHSGVESAPGAESCSQAASPAAPGAPEAFKQFMAAVTAPGTLDAVQKELMIVALSVAVQCEPCLRIHLEKCRNLGIAPERVREAAWMGVAFGGCKAMMFWQEKGPA